MKKVKFLASLLAVISLSVISIVAGQKPVEKDSITKNTPDATVNVAEKQVLLFVNPNGRPCQIQLAIIDQMKAELSLPGW